MRLCRQALEIVDEAVAGILGVLVVHPDVDRFLRAHFLAVAAEDATELVDLVNQRIAVPSSSSPGTSLMQFAGQICGHRPQATHFARPCSSVSMRCVPRHREESVQSLEDFSSGYCIVTLGRNRWLKVNAIPFSVARRYDV